LSGVSFFTAKGDDHQLAAEIGVFLEIAQGPDRDDGVRGMIATPQPIGMIDRNDPIDVRIFRQQFAPDAIDATLSTPQ
jgi:hypothetical protein